MTDGMSWLGNFFKEQNMEKTFGNYKSDKELQEARKKHQEAEAEYKKKFRRTLDGNDEMKKDMFISINKRNALDKLKQVHAEYRTALKDLISQKKLNDIKQHGSGDDGDEISAKKELNNLKFMNIDINNILKVNQRKTHYELQGLKSIRSYRSTFMSIYILLVFVFLILMFQKKKYKEYKFWGIFLFIVLYPYFINYIMLNLITTIKFAFNHFTPVNSYRNLYNQDVNKTDREDIDLTYHYTYLSPTIEEKVNTSSSDKIDKLEKDKYDLQQSKDDLETEFNLYKVRNPSI